MPGLINDDYVSMTLEFRCNLKCNHCMIEGTMDYLHAETPENFEQLLAHNAEHRRWTGLIMTGYMSAIALAITIVLVLLPV